MSDPPHARRRVVAAPPRTRAELRAIRVIVEEDPDPDASYLNEDGRAALDQGDFRFVGIHAEAEVPIEGIMQTLTSDGIWGIESDAEEYITQVTEHEWGALRNVLKAVGVSTEQLPLEVNPEWIEWRL